MREAIRPGIRECDLMGIGAKRLYELGADEVQEFVIASGPRTNPLHIDFTDRQVRPGDLVVIDINAACFQGYKSCYYRTFCCGRATQAIGYLVSRFTILQDSCPIRSRRTVSRSAARCCMRE